MYECIVHGINIVYTLSGKRCREEGYKTEKESKKKIQINGGIRLMTLNR